MFFPTAVFNIDTWKDRNESLTSHQQLPVVVHYNAISTYHCGSSQKISISVTMMPQFWFFVSLLFLTTLSTVEVNVHSFSFPNLPSPLSSSTTPPTTTTCHPLVRHHVFLAVTSGSSDGKKKKRRRRKEASTAEDERNTFISSTMTNTKKSISTPPSSSASPPPLLPPIVKSTPSLSVKETMLDNNCVDDAIEKESNYDEMTIATIKDIADFSFDGSIEGVGSNPSIASPSTSLSSSLADEDQSTASEAEDNTIPLPDIKDALKRKEVKAEIARVAEEQAERKKIDRNDRVALLKVIHAIKSFVFLDRNLASFSNVIFLA
jgi:hypothetical protein